MTDTNTYWNPYYGMTEKQVAHWRRIDDAYTSVLRESLEQRQRIEALEEENKRLTDYAQKQKCGPECSANYNTDARYCYCGRADALGFRNFAND